MENRMETSMLGYCIGVVNWDNGQENGTRKWKLL